MKRCAGRISHLPFPHCPRSVQFASVWDYYVNGIGSRPPVNLSQKHLFDLENNI